MFCIVLMYYLCYTKERHMNATFDLSRIITIITDNFVTTCKYAQLHDMLARYNEVTITGTSKPAKLQKYMNEVQAAGFRHIETNWMQHAGFEGANADIVNYSITFIKA